MRITLHDFTLHRADLRLRLPFRYGIATMTEAPLLFVKLEAEVNGRRVTGVSSDLLPPKWFTKIPGKSVAEETAEMLGVIRHACQLATGLRGESPFSIWRELWLRQEAWGAAERLPPLLCHFGTSLVERAMLDAACRAAGRPFWQRLHADELGLDLTAVHPELRGHRAAEFLPEAPLPHVTLRHTVGLGDPLTDDEIAPESRLADGLPQTLEACIRRHGLRHFKIKLSGQSAPDFERLIRLAEILRREAGGSFAFSLDGNEQFTSVEDFRTFWEAASAQPVLRDFLKHLLFVEQPLHRDVALENPVGAAFANWPDRPPVIIDESDATLESLPCALRLGYAGTSHKNCKGVFKGIANRCLLELRRWREPHGAWLMSGEDLCNVGPVALLQDLAVMAALGIESVERNGHHYHPGLSCLPRTVQEQTLAAHPDLYERSMAGWPTLKIAWGRIDLRSVNAAPFGTDRLSDFAECSRVL